MSEYKDLNELLSITRNINEGRYNLLDVNIDPHQEIYDIAKYFNESVKKLQLISSEKNDKHSDIPIFEQVLNDVINDSQAISDDGLNLIDKVNFNIDELKDTLLQIDNQVEKEKYLKAEIMLDKVLSKIVEGQDICFDIISSLEFKENNIVKIEESFAIIESLGEKLSSLLIQLGIKYNIIDIDKLDELKTSKGILNDQNLIDKLLKKFGVS